jgi:PAS domain S-box-containing protein
MRWFHNLGLSGRIMMILSCAGLAFLAILVTDVLDYRNRMVATAIDDVEAGSREAAEDFGYLLAKGRRVLDLLPAIPAVTDASSACSGILRDAVSDSRINNLIRFDAAGRGQCGSFEEAPGMDIADRGFFERARRTTGFVVSDTYTSPDNGDTVIMLARPVQGESGFDGVIGATFTLDTAAGITDLASELPAGSISIVDAGGRILVQEKADGSATSNPGRLTPSLMRTVRDHRTGHTRLTGNTGPLVVGFAELGAPGSKLYAVVQVPEETILAPARALMTKDIVFGVLVLVVTMTAIFFTLRRQVVTPVRHLLTTTNRLAAGDYAAPREKRRHNAGELSRLGERLEELATILAARERELTATSQHRQAVVDNLPQAVLVLDANHRVAAVNAAFVHDLDMPTELLREGTHIEGFIRYSAERGDYGDMDADTAVTHWLAMIRDRQPVDFDKIGPRGQTLAVQGRPLPDGGYLGVYSDITERKRLADTFAAFFHNASRRDLDFDGRIAAVLEIGRAHFGLPVGLVAQVNGDNYEVLYVAADGANVPVRGHVFPFAETYCALALKRDDVVAFEHASAQGLRNARCYQRFGIEAYIGAPVHIDGELFGALNFHSGEAARRQFVDSDRQVLRLLAQWLGAEMGRQMDFEQLRSTQASLSEQQAYLEAVIDATEEGIAPVNQRGEIVTANSAMHRIFATNPDGLAGSHLANLFAPAERGTVTDALAAIRGPEKEPGGNGRQIEASGLRTDGTPFPAKLYLAPMALKDSELVVAVIHDASEAHQAETIKNQFVSTVSHELRTPLTSIVGSLGLVRGGAAGELPERAASLIDMAHRNASRLIGLVNDILDFERLRSGRIEVHPQSVELGEQMEVARQNNAGYAEQACCRLDVHRPDQPVTVQVDPDRLQQVFSNLISNAAKFSPEDEAVYVWADRDEANRTVTITVRDRGGGIPDSVRDRLFQPFVQADPADNRKHQKGTGLGLAISRSILERMAGSIWVESQPGDTRFFVRLPIAEASGSA